MPIYNLKEFSKNYEKMSGNSWQYHKDDPSDNIAGPESFKFKAKVRGTSPAAGNTNDVDIDVPLKSPE